MLVELDTADDVARLYAEIRRRRPAGLIDVVPAARTVLLTGPGAVPLAAELPQWSLAPIDTNTGTACVEIPTVYDGEDLADTAAACGLSLDALIDLHAGAAYRVAFCGFSPGFAYLEGLPPVLQHPRRDTPRTRVPAGSVAIAGAWCGIYPRSSPGGWHLLGRTPLELWNGDCDPPARLTPGTAVRFVRVAP